MRKDPHIFEQDIDAILHDKESRLTQIQEAWEKEDATPHLAKYDTYHTDKAIASFWQKVASIAPDSHTTKQRLHRSRLQVAGRALHHYRTIAAAASVAILIGVATMMLLPDTKTPSLIDQIAALPAANDSLPHIILADGSVQTVADGVQADGMQAKVDGATIILAEADEETAPTLQMEQLVIPRGKMYKLELYDGTKILLNSESSIRFPNRFEKTRNIELKGEAYFEVAKDGRPFTVSTPQGTITVLGTSFSVSAYTSQPFKVALTSGRISFRNPHTHATLTAGQILTCDADGHATISTANPQRQTSWTQGVIFFDDMTLEDIMHNIERMYDVHIHYSNEAMKQLRFSGECSRFSSVETFMSLLSMTEDFGYLIDGRDIYIQQADAHTEANPKE